MLVQSGLKIADQYAIKTYVMSEPAASKLSQTLVQASRNVSTGYIIFLFASRRHELFRLSCLSS